MSQRARDAEPPAAGSLPTPRRDVRRSLREQLCIPTRMSLPRWAEERLFAAVREQAQSREGVLLADVVFGVIDLETTGVSAERNQILEIGLVVQRAGRTLGRYSTLIDNGVYLPAFIRALTGIAPEDLEGAPVVEAALEQLEAVLSAHRVTQLVAHNAPFDRGFLERAWQSSARTRALPPFLCSLRLARRLVSAPSYGLGVLAQQLAIPVRARHRALADAEVTARLWHELLQRARVQGVHALESLAKLARPRRGRRRAPRRHLVDAAPGIG